MRNAIGQYNWMWVRARVQVKVPAVRLSICLVCGSGCVCVCSLLGLCPSPACRTNKLIFYWITNNKRKRKKSIKKTAYKNWWPWGEGQERHVVGGTGEWVEVGTSTGTHECMVSLYIHSILMWVWQPKPNWKWYYPRSSSQRAFPLSQLTPYSHLSFNPPSTHTPPPPISICAFIESIGHLRLLLI